MPPSLERPVRWEGHNYILPALRSLSDVRSLRPRELEARFFDIRENRTAIADEKVKSCLNNMLTAYLTAARDAGIIDLGGVKRIMEDFKNSSDWEGVFRRHGHVPNSHIGRQHAPPPPAAPSGLPRAPGGPLAPAAGGSTSSRAPAATLSHRPAASSSTRPIPPTSSVLPNPTTMRDSPLSRPQSSNQSDRPPNPWKMPGRPSWSLSDMTFSKFVSHFSEMNGVDPQKGYMPWETVITWFKDYVNLHWRHSGQEAVSKHLLYALSTTPMKAQVPSATMEKHLRPLKVGFAEETRAHNGTQGPQNAPQQAQRGNAATIAAGAAAETKKRGRENDDGSSISPSNKQVKLEMISPASHSKWTKLPTNDSFKAAQPAATPVAKAVLEGAKASPNANGDGESLNRRIAERGAELSNGSLVPPAPAQGKELLPGLGRARQVAAPSPAPSASAWLTANFAPDAQQYSFEPWPTTTLPLAAETAYNPVNTQQGIMPGIRAAAPSTSRSLATKAFVRLDIILNGVLEDLDAMITKAKEPASTEPLAPEQQNMIGKLIWSHKMALKELAELQQIMEGS